MIRSTSANPRPDLRSAPNSYLSSMSSSSASAQPTQIALDMRLERLLFANRPPIDAVSYTLPLKSVADKGCFAELDARIAFLRDQGSHAPGEDIVQMVHEQHCRSLMVTREAVQDFFNDGVCPRDHVELKALALFLLTNGLFDALTWLVAQSGADTLDLHRCNLGDEGAGTVAKWARTLPFKVRLDLSNNRMEAEGARLLAEVLEADTIFALDLGLNPLGDEGVQLVCTGLAKNSSVRSLYLSHVGADSAGMEAVAGVLDTHPSLVSLNLDANGYDDAAATVLLPRSVITRHYAAFRFITRTQAMPALQQW